MLTFQDLDTRGLAKKGLQSYNRSQLPKGVSVISLPPIAIRLPGENVDSELMLKIRLNKTTIERMWVFTHFDQSFFPSADFSTVILAAINGLSVIQQFGVLTVNLLPDIQYKAGWREPDGGTPTSIDVWAVTDEEAADMATDYIINTYEGLRSRCGNPYIVRVNEQRNPIAPQKTLSVNARPSLRNPSKYTLTYEELNKPEGISQPFTTTEGPIAATLMAAQYLVDKYGPGITGAVYMAVDPILRDDNDEIVAICFPFNETKHPAGV